MVMAVANGAEHNAVLPRLLPAHVQFHGPEPVTAEGRPVVQRPLDGVLLTATPLAKPQEPLIRTGAWHCAVVPPLLPLQDQVHGPLPVTAEAAPALQRLVVGALVRSAPFEDPQTPFTAVTPGVSVA